jgi:hypothetical protein
VVRTWVMGTPGQGLLLEISGDRLQVEREIPVLTKTCRRRLGRVPEISIRALSFPRLDQDGRVVASEFVIYGVRMRRLADDERTALIEAYPCPCTDAADWPTAAEVSRALSGFGDAPPFPQSAERKPVGGDVSTRAAPPLGSVGVMVLRAIDTALEQLFPERDGAKWRIDLVERLRRNPVVTGDQLLSCWAEPRARRSEVCPEFLAEVALESLELAMAIAYYANALHTGANDPREYWRRWSAACYFAGRACAQAQAR